MRDQGTEWGGRDIENKIISMRLMGADLQLSLLLTG
jgi:hypothetical protein